MKNTILILLALFCGTQLTEAKSKKDSPPNVILVLTDDQGIGDLGCHGNPWLKTPNLDEFYEESVRFTDFHVSPYCTPTRGALMTGLYPINNGTWATYKGRDLLSGNDKTMADIFKMNGYKTGIFGKWHLGDNYPVRPTDCGFDQAVHHLAGGVGELSDYWGNSYFDDVYYVNNEAQQFEGYCTNVWFDQAMKFISENKDHPFFVYLPTNAPHSPWIVADEYADPYRKLAEEKKIVSAEFYGMLVNFDENFGKLEAFLKKNKLADNTILIFMTDNGSSGGISPNGKIGYNKGFKGKKGTKYEGGHRVPFFIRWKDGKIKGGKDINELAAHVDLLPTLAALCDLKIPEDKVLDGIDLSGLLEKNGTAPERDAVFVHHNQDWRPPKDVKQTCIIEDQWRLVNGDELYDVSVDQGQQNNVAADHPEVVENLLLQNKNFLKKTKKNATYHELSVNTVGSKFQDEIKLTIQHAIGEDGGIWKSQQVADGMKNKNNTHAIEIAEDGEYYISCRRWPKECPGPIWGVPDENPKDMYNYYSIKPQKVRITIANQIHEKDIKEGDVEVLFKLQLKKGKTLLTTDFIDGKETYGVYYTYVGKQ